MTPERRATVLFWCQVGLFVCAMVTMLGILATLIFFTISQIRALDENRERDKAMLQQHTDTMHEHARAREQHALAFEAMLERLRR